jgi:phosphatidylinositol 3-kinase
MLKLKNQKRRSDRMRSASVEREETFKKEAIYLELKLSLGGGDIFYEHRTDVVSVDNITKETIVFPVKLNDLPVQTAVSISLYNFYKEENNGLIGSTWFYLFDIKKRMRQGFYNLVIWENQLPDLSYSFKTPGFPDNDKVTREINVLLSKIRQEEPKDALTYEAIKDKLKQLYIASKRSYIEICLPDFDYPVLFFESCYNSIIRDIIYPKYMLESYEAAYLENDFKKDPIEEIKKDCDPDKICVFNSGIIRFHDCAMMKKQGLTSNIESYNNPLTEKYYILTKIEDPEIAKGLTPDRETHEEIMRIIELPDFTTLPPKDKNLIWKYRYFIKNDESYKKGVVKLLQSVNWSKAKDEWEALEMLQDWTIDPEQALPMLSSLFSANEIYTIGIAKDKCIDVRRRAIECLNKEDLKTIKMILLQLTQAYRYEDFEKGLLKEFFLSKVTKNRKISHKFFWIIKLEKDNQGNLPEIQDQYKALYDEFMSIMEEELPELKALLLQQVEFRNNLHTLSKHIQGISGVENKKRELRRVIDKNGEFEMINFKPTQMPLDPKVEVCGIVPEKWSVFPSAMWPLKLTFKVTKQTEELNLPRVDKNHYLVMYKVGDDVRQDQLVLQTIDLMDSLLKKINYDFKFTVYKVLAFSEDDGMVEFVPKCLTIHDILHKYENKINLYLAQWSKNNEYDYNKIFETYLDSCAGYWVVTYLLGVGDRHLENLLIDETGHMFHVDFGFIFGKNPPRKNVMPPIRIWYEMIECMGGFKSHHYQKFLDKWVNAFRFLRNHSKYILNLFYLMIHAEIADLPAEDSEDILNRMYQKFFPEIKDPVEVDKEFSTLIKNSINSFFAKAFEVIHKYAQILK